MIQILWHFVVTQQYVLNFILVNTAIFQEFTEKSLLTQAAHKRTLFFFGEVNVIIFMSVAVLCVSPSF